MLLPVQANETSTSSNISRSIHSTSQLRFFRKKVSTVDEITGNISMAVEENGGKYEHNTMSLNICTIKSVSDKSSKTTYETNDDANADTGKILEETANKQSCKKTPVKKPVLAKKVKPTKVTTEKCSVPKKRKQNTPKDAKDG